MSSLSSPAPTPPRRTHALTEDAGPSRASWAKLLSWDTLRYQRSGWWLDAALPRSPAGVLVLSLALPLAWFAIGLLVTDDREGYVTTPDIVYQIPFFALHVVCLRATASLWSRGLGPALDGLGVEAPERRPVVRGLFGPWSNAGALLSCAYFVVRDTYVGVVPDEESGLTAFWDPDRWDFGSLGPDVHGLMMGMWHLEWLIFGYLLWLQLWSLVSISTALFRTDFAPHLARMLVEDRYRDFFTLLAKGATVSLVFALANLGFIHVTGELIPRENVYVGDIPSFLREMSDLLSTTLLFLLLFVGFVGYVIILRKALTRAVNRLFAEAGDVALRELAEPLALEGDPEADVKRLAARVEAQAGLVRATVFQREVDAIGSRTLLLITLKSLVPLVTAAARMLKMGG